MRVQDVVANSGARTRAAIGGIARFAKLERVLAVLCACTPALLILADQGNVRDSISAYHNVSHPEMFYMPLTAAAMLFLVNGVVKDGQLYNIFLGAALAGLVLFNTHTFHAPHIVFTAAFFVGNVIVVIALAMMGWYSFGWFTLFWAEWISLGIIAAHYVIESVVDGRDPAADGAAIQV